MDNLRTPIENYPPSGHETKFVINNSATHIIIRWLQLRCQNDPEYPAGIISSIYYDTKEFRYLFEKINSDFLKTKVRVRWYSDIDSGEPEDRSYLEVKYKVGSKRKKIRTKTNISGRWLSQVNLNNNKLLFPSHLLKSMNVLWPEQLYPVFLICYKRRRFVEPVTGARICFDYDISSPKVNCQMLEKFNPFRLQNAVFELKGRINELPDVLHQLTALGCRKQSFSKYLMCYKKIMRITT